VNNRRSLRAKLPFAAIPIVVLCLAPLIGSDPSVGAAAPSPSYSATGVRINGASEIEFSIVGLPSGQINTVGFGIFSSPLAGGTSELQVSGSSVNALWNLASPDFPPGGITSVEVSFPSLSSGQPGAKAIPATNLAPGFQLGPQSNYYLLTMPNCSPGPTPPVVASASTPSGLGYWQTTPDGEVLGFGDAMYFGSMSGIPLNHPIVGITPTPDGKGYWLVASDGGVFAFGDAAFLGSAGNLQLNRPVVGMAASQTGKGYYLVASDGGIFSYGDTAFQGSTGALQLNRPVVGMTIDPQTKGYWLVASDGGVFSFNAHFFGSAGGIQLNRPIVGIESRTGSGYRLVATDGGVLSFGASPFFGSLGAASLTRPIVGIFSSNDDAGYTLTGSDGGVFAFGDAGYYGSITGTATIH